MNRVGIGIIGCGNISDAYLLGAARSPHVSVEGVADIVPEAATAKAGAYGVAARSVDELLDDSAIEIVVNLTVPLVHAEVSSRILQSGKHVYSEKPLAATLNGARQLMSEAADASLRVGCAPDTFFGAAHQAARRAIDDGLIGTVWGGAAALLNKGMEHWHPSPDFLFKRGAGPVLDIGPYFVTQLVNLLGPVARVTALGSRPRTQRVITSQPRSGEYIDVEVDTTVNSVLAFKSGANVSFTLSWDVLDHNRPLIELYGEQGSLVCPTPNWFHGDVLVSPESGAWQPLDVSAFPFGAINREPRPGVIVADYRGVGLADMAVAIREDRPHRASGDLALHVLEVLEGILLSAEEGRACEMTTTCERPAPLRHGVDEGVLLTD